MLCSLLSALSSRGSCRAQSVHNQASPSGNTPFPPTRERRSTPSEDSLNQARQAIKNRRRRCNCTEPHALVHLARSGLGPALGPGLGSHRWASCRHRCGPLWVVREPAHTDASRHAYVQARAHTLREPAYTDASSGTHGDGSVSSGDDLPQRCWRGSADADAVLLRTHQESGP